jgi:HSP20 family molecular chaperone IbpA
MFKQKCPRCKKSISKSFEFCPHCGAKNKSIHPEDFGMLGQNDFDNLFPVKGFGFSLLDKLMNNAMKIIETQMRNSEIKEISTPSSQKLNVQFFINGKKVNLGRDSQETPKEIKTKLNIENPERFSKLPKFEPKSRIRRLSGKLIYELEVPGVKNIEDILINKLENSIEIKAISDKKVYSKIININLPIIAYKLQKENLILELQTK